MHNASTSHQRNCGMLRESQTHKYDIDTLSSLGVCDQQVWLWSQIEHLAIEHSQQHKTSTSNCRPNRTVWSAQHLAHLGNHASGTGKRQVHNNDTPICSQTLRYFWHCPRDEIPSPPLLHPRCSLLVESL